jgi:hypothetical protein
LQGEKSAKASVHSPFNQRLLKKAAHQRKYRRPPGAPTGKGAKDVAFAFGGQPAGLKTGKSEYSYYTGMPKNAKCAVMRCESKH